MIVPYGLYCPFDRPKTFTEVNEIMDSLKERDVWPSLVWVAVYGSEDGGEVVGYAGDAPQALAPEQRE